MIVHARNIHWFGGYDEHPLSDLPDLPHSWQGEIPGEIPEEYDADAMYDLWLEIVKAVEEDTGHIGEIEDLEFDIVA